VNGPWALRVAARSSAQVASLRLQGGIDVHEGHDGLWLRGASASPQVWRELAAVPSAERFVVDGAGACRAVGQHLPAATLPTGPWQPLASWCTVALATTAAPAAVPLAVPLRAVRGGAETAANVLRTSLVALGAWADGAALVRLLPLRFAASPHGEVLVHGQPLPPLPGAVFVEAHGVALPAGCEFAARVPRELVAVRLQLQPGDLALCADTGAIELVRALAFVQLSRAAVRTTFAEVRRA
jgi:hypothetical protein